MSVNDQDIQMTPGNGSGGKINVEKMGLRERKRLETYLRIEDKATQLFLEKDYDSVTLEEICEAAMVSRRTFFNYFQSKEHVAVGTIPVGLKDEDYQRFEEMEVPEGSSLSHELTTIMATGRLAHAQRIRENSINPELSKTLSERRVELLRRNPALGMSKLSNFEKTRLKLVEAVLKNLEKHPEHRILPGRSARDEARIVVTATTLILWAASTLNSEKSEPYLTEHGTNQTAADFATVLAAMNATPIFPEHRDN